MKNSRTNEFEGLKKDSVIFEQKSESFKNNFSGELKNGLGAKIKYTLNNPPKITKAQIIKHKIKIFFKTLIDIL